MVISKYEEFDDQAFMLSVYERYSRLMFNTAWKYVTNDTVVEDLIQESISKLIPKVRTLRTLNRCTLTAYIVYTIRNTSINYLRRQEIEKQYKATENFDDIENDMSSEVFTPEEILLTSEHMAEFCRVWKLLTNEDQLLLSGKYFLDLSDSDLAKQIGCKPNSIRMKLTRARRRAFDVFQEEGFNHDKT